MYKNNYFDGYFFIQIKKGVKLNKKSNCMENMNMRAKNFAVNEYVTSDEIKKIRKKLHLTQKEFAQLVGSSKPTIER